MKNYERPFIVVNEELAEGVYAASGAVAGGSTTGGTSSSTNCFGFSPNLQGSSDSYYYIDMQITHLTANGSDPHASTGLIITFNFNQPVKYAGAQSCSPASVSGDGTSTITIQINTNVDAQFWGGYLGQVKFESEAGLSLTGYSVSCIR